jgi:hypothetical protein
MMRVQPLDDERSLRRLCGGHGRLFASGFCGWFPQVGQPESVKRHRGPKTKCVALGLPWVSCSGGAHW